LREKDSKGTGSDDTHTESAGPAEEVGVIRGVGGGSLR